jgi:hypothetical protein
MKRRRSDIKKRKKSKGHSRRVKLNRRLVFLAVKGEKEKE